MSSFLCGRFKKIAGILKTIDLDAVLLNSPQNISYVCGFSAPDSYLLISSKGPVLVTDFRYTADFKKKANSGLKVVEQKNSIFKTISSLVSKGGFKKIGFESRKLTFAECQRLHELSKNKVTWIPLKECIEPFREIKEKEELSDIRLAVKITLGAYEFIRKELKAGIEELRIVAELERYIRYHGAYSGAFDTIVASGPNSSYPHARASDRRIKNGEPVIIDMGVNVNGYNCDLTRTYFLGRINPIVRRLDSIVRKAQELAIRAIKPGVLIKDIDAAARNYIKNKGFGKNFGHSLGHGVGLEVHEAPYINSKNNCLLKEGMVFTVEPGIYMAGSYGIRWEEMVLVTNNGVEVLSGNYRY